jgi:hypothetical protein
MYNWFKTEHKFKTWTLTFKKLTSFKYKQRLNLYYSFFITGDCDITFSIGVMRAGKLYSCLNLFDNEF